VKASVVDWSSDATLSIQTTILIGIEQSVSSVRSGTRFG
jgi:hypothetical protein